MKTATINGIDLAYHDEGQGQPILFIHAFPLHSAMWEPQIAAFSSRYRLIAPDLRGLGATARGGGAASLDQHADDMAALLDQLGLEQVTVAGLSMGGYISFALLRRHPQRIATLILADTRAGADSAEGRQGREQNARLAEEQGSGAIADQMLPKLLSASAPTALRDEVRGIIESNDRAGIAAALRAMAARPDSTSLLAAIEVPVLVIVGAEDTLTPPSEAEAMFDAIPGCRLANIPLAGHLSNLEAPDAFNTALDEFLAPRQTFGVGGGGSGKW
ncbi:MAG TPA: alpha/beta fold hydrolase [Roseiflexaceae bacterium]|nr:alpha/beta fold hydrolase [Roseiflexaceae bacterium]